MGSDSMGTQTPVLPGHPFRPFDLVHIRIHSDHSKLGQVAYPMLGCLKNRCVHSETLAPDKIGQGNPTPT